MYRLVTQYNKDKETDMKKVIEICSLKELMLKREVVKFIKGKKISKKYCVSKVNSKVYQLN